MKKTKATEQLEKLHQAQIDTMKQMYEGLVHGLRDQLNEEIARNTQLNDELVATRRELQLAMGRPQ